MCGRASGSGTDLLHPPSPQQPRPVRDDQLVRAGAAVRASGGSRVLFTDAVKRRWPGPVAVALLAVLAVIGSSRIDGPVLVTIAPGHGVHVTDVLALLAALVALSAMRCR